MTLIQNEPKNIKLGTTSIKKVYLGSNQVRPRPVDCLCFTANTAGSTIQLNIKQGSPTVVTLETSTDGQTWSTYTIGNTITLSNVGDKVYWRNTSTTTTGFSTSGSNCYQFVMTGSIAGSGDINYLLNKNSTTIISDYCYTQLFYNCASLTVAPSLPATTIGGYSYYQMFDGCTSLTTAPSLPATTIEARSYRDMFSGCTGLTTLPKLAANTLEVGCYYSMFKGCSNIKLSATQTGSYQTPYRIPSAGTGTDATNALVNMFTSTGGTFTGTPSINTTYYTSNTLV